MVSDSHMQDGRVLLLRCYVQPIVSVGFEDYIYMAFFCPDFVDNIDTS